MSSVWRGGSSSGEGTTAGGGDGSLWWYIGVGSRPPRTPLVVVGDTRTTSTDNHSMRHARPRWETPHLHSTPGGAGAWRQPTTPLPLQDTFQ